MRRATPIVALFALVPACEEDNDPPAAATTSAGTTGEVDPWWLGAFHNADYAVGSNASLLVVGNLELREDGTATGTTHFCDDDPEVIEYTWTMDGDSVTLAGDPLIWEGGEVGPISITRGTGFARAARAIEKRGDRRQFTVDATRFPLAAARLGRGVLVFVFVFRDVAEDP